MEKRQKRNTDTQKNKMTKDKLIGMTLRTYNRFRRNFKAKKKETVEDYFERLSKYIAMLKEGKQVPIMIEAEKRKGGIKKNGK